MLTLTRKEWAEARQKAIRLATRDIMQRLRCSRARAGQLARQHVERQIEADGLHRGPPCSMVERLSGCFQPVAA